MSVVIHAIQSVLSIVVMIAVGVILARRGWFNEESAKLIADLVSKVSLPCVVLLNITSNFNRDNFGELAYGLVLPILSVVISYYVGSLFVRLLKVPQGRRALFKAMFYVSNCMYIGLPINLALFGESSTVFVLEYFAANTVALWAVAVYQIAAEGAARTSRPAFWQIIKKIIFSPLLGFITAIILIVLGIGLSPLVKDTCRYLGAMTTPLSMIFIGYVLSETHISEIKLDMESIVALVGRFAVSPLVLLGLHIFIPAGDMQFKVFIIQAATPAAVSLPILAATYGLDTKYAAFLTTVSTVLFMLAIPFYMWILH